MTFVTLYSGNVVLKSGQVGTGSGPGCCCDGGSGGGGVCCLNCNCTNTYETQAACEEAGGTWQAGKTCAQNPCPGLVGQNFALGGCMGENCEADWRAALEAAGWTDIQIEFAGGQDDCGNKWLHFIGASCCGTIGGECGSLPVGLRCQGPCGASPPNCNDQDFVIEAEIPICCQNPLP